MSDRTSANDVTENTPTPHNNRTPVPHPKAEGEFTRGMKAILMPSNPVIKDGRTPSSNRI
jgi:hypothetical protein